MADISQIKLGDTTYDIKAKNVFPVVYDGTNMDKTYAEVLAAYQANKAIYAIWGNEYY